jgi:uncharacterized protein
MAKDFSTMEDSNRSSNLSIHSVSPPSRRSVLHLGAGVAASAVLAPFLSGCANAAFTGPRIGFKAIPIDSTDRLQVPEGYVATALAQWGEPIGVPGNMPAFKIDGSNSAAEQAVQMGMHHDGLHFYALSGAQRGLLVMNHEYVDDGLLHAGGFKDWTAEKVKKSQAAHGISVIEVTLKGNSWEMVRPSALARRITATTPFEVRGPAQCA